MAYSSLHVLFLLLALLAFGNCEQIKNTIAIVHNNKSSFLPSYLSSSKDHVQYLPFSRQPTEINTKHINHNFKATDLINSNPTLISPSILNTLSISRGGALSSYFPAGWHPFGYGLMDLGVEFLVLDGSLDSDIGRLLASLKSGRKKRPVLKQNWVEIVRQAKDGQSMRVLRTLDDLIAFCLKAGFIN